METNEIVFTLFGQKAKANCDRNCNKAWGVNMRPRNHKEQFFLDEELGKAPKNPDTSEGFDMKPVSPDGFFAGEGINKWCLRECERCRISNPGEWRNPMDVLTF